MAKDAAPLRREQVLAYIIERIVRDRASPTGPEIARHFGFTESRAKQLVDKLVTAGRIERVPGAVRGLRVRDLAENRLLLADMLRSLGWTVANPGGALEGLPHSQLALIAVLDHVPELPAGDDDASLAA